MKNKKLLIGAAIVIALGVAAYFIFRKPSTEEVEKKAVTADAKNERKFIIK
jgi:uncharacterized protein (UPF0333 family)